MRQLHLKSGWCDDVPAYDDQLFTAADFCPLGRGIVQMAAVLAQAAHHPITRTFIEQDDSNDVYADVAASIAWLN